MNASFQCGSADFAGLHDFGPNAERVRFLDARMRGRLDDSLRYLVEQLEAHIPIPEEKFAAFLTRLRKGPFPALAFAIYSDLVFAVDGGGLKEARRLLHLLLAQEPHSGGLRIRELGDTATDENAARYVRYIDTDPRRPLSLVPPARGSVARCREAIAEALVLLGAADPELSAEIGELLHEIILCENGARPGTFPFDAASNFMLWGAVLTNARIHKDGIGMLQMLAHESAHNLLFGFCPDQPLLNNDPEERHPSPLRADLRPLEGIYHATFVCARMHRALRRLSEDAGISSGQKAEVEKAAERNGKAFAAGMATLDKHADFTEPGRAIIEGARAYMASA